MELTIIILAGLLWLVFEMRLVYMLLEARHQAAFWKMRFIELSAKQIKGDTKWI